MVEDLSYNLEDQINNIRSLRSNYHTLFKDNFPKFQQADRKSGKFWEEKDIMEAE